MWLGEMGTDRANRPPSKLRPLGQAWPGGCLPETLEGINPHWRTQLCLQVAAQCIMDEEVL